MNIINRYIRLKKGLLRYLKNNKDKFSEGGYLIPKGYEKRLSAILSFAEKYMGAIPIRFVLNEWKKRHPEDYRDEFGIIKISDTQSYVFNIKGIFDIEDTERIIKSVSKGLEGAYIDEVNLKIK